MKEKDIMHLITQDYSWEQVLYDVIAWEGIDPWDLDITKLSGSFVQYIGRMDMLDFKVPAKYVIIAAVLLRMKSDHLNFIDWLTNPEQPVEEMGGEIDQGAELPKLDVNPITVPPIRHARRKVTANELVLALRRVLSMQERRREVSIKARGEIRINQESITEKISELYQRINSIMEKMRKEEIMFSNVVGKWGRSEVVDTFVPLVYLDHEKKVSCRQEEMFKEIFISRYRPGAVQEEPEQAAAAAAPSEGRRARRLVPAV